MKRGFADGSFAKPSSWAERSEVEGSREVTFDVLPRDFSALLGMTLFF
jgi:hypothetical protein